MRNETDETVTKTEQTTKQEPPIERTAWVDQFPDDTNWDCFRKQDCNEDTSTIRILAHRRGTDSWGLLTFEALSNSLRRTDWVPVADPTPLFAEESLLPEDPEAFVATQRQPAPPLWVEWCAVRDGELVATSTSVLHRLALADWEELGMCGVGEPFPPGKIIGVGDDTGTDYIILIRRHRGRYFEDWVHIGYDQTHDVKPLTEDQAKAELARFADESAARKKLYGASTE